MMRSVMLMLGGLMVMTLVGCAPTFAGEWLERPLTEPIQFEESMLGARRAALQFDPVATVRYGAYNELHGVVDANSVAGDQYLLFDGGRTAQFGAIMARLESADSLVASVSGGQPRYFSRVKGKSIFPPLVVLPQMYGDAAHEDRPRYLSMQE